MRLSYRDHRMDNSVSSGFWVMLALISAMGVLAFLVPWTAVGVAALLGLAVLGGGYVLRSERALSEYVGDLRSVRGGGDASGWLRFEVGTDVPPERPVGLATRRSPHTRPARGGGKEMPTRVELPD